MRENKQAVSSSRSMRLTLLAVGPFITLMLARGLVAGHIGAVELPLLDMVVFLAWSPLFFSLPALLCQHERDAALPQYDGMLGSLYRGIILIPYLLTRGSGMQAEMIVSLTAWVVLGIITLGSLLQVVAPFLS
jgi:hypothetical protein